MEREKKVDLNNPLVQAKLLVVERVKEVKQLPKMSYRDMEGLMKALAGPQGCSHVIVNIGLSSGVWENVEAILCDAEVMASTTDLGTYTPGGDVERIVAEVYSIDKNVLDELERLSQIKIPEESVSMISKAYEQPPVVKITPEELAAPKYPTDLLPRVEGDLGELKDVSHAIVVYLESEKIDKYSVMTVSDSSLGKASLIILGPEYVSKMGKLLTELSELLKEYGVSYVVLKSGMKTLKRSLK